ncbi:MAG: hypothetical protein HZA92_19820 [Verrucomicrobia bacterium]|nr:hypothetical protein [Verrucomicrobiota bacterium]
MLNYFIPVLALALVAGGCRKKSQPETSGPSVATPTVPEAATVSNAPPAQGPAPLKVRAATPEDIAAYNRELSAWINVHDDVPKDLEDLKKRQGLPPLPTPPPGLRIVYLPRLDRPTWSSIRME